MHLKIKNFKLVEYVFLLGILVIAIYFYLQNLGTNYITLWDEVVHVNVVKNISEDIWPPKLHLTDIGIDFQDWTNNYIWVHKPLMPLYLQAFFYKIFPSLFMFRLPAVIFALGLIFGLYFIAKKHFGLKVAIISALFMACNPYVLELVKGRQFSGLHDLMFCFFGILALNQILNINKITELTLPSLLNKEGTRWNWLLFGLFVGLGYLSKGGLAFLFFIPLMFFCYKNYKNKQIILNFFYAVLISFILIFPEKIVLLLLYPAEYFFEQSLQILHLFRYLEYWGRPWDYYITIYLRDILSPQVMFPVLGGVVFALYNWHKDVKSKILVIWVLAFFIPLSAGITKISNFLLPTLPALFILCALFFLWLIQNKKYELIVSFSVTTFLLYALIRLDIARVKFHLFQEFALLQRLSILIFSVLMFCLLYALLFYLKQKVNLIRFYKPILFFSFALVLGTSLRAMQINNNKVYEDFDTQSILHSATKQISNSLEQNAIVLTYFPNLKKSHLYFQYWSGIDAMEIHDRQPEFLLVDTLPQNRPLYLLSSLFVDASTLDWNLKKIR